MNYKTPSQPLDSGGFVQSILYDVNYGVDHSGGSKPESFAPNPRDLAACDFPAIAAAWRDGHLGSVQQLLACLSRVTFWQDFPFDVSFVESGLAGLFLAQLVSGTLPRLSGLVLRVVVNVSSYRTNYHYIRALHGLGLLGAFREFIGGAGALECESVTNLTDTLSNIALFAASLRDEVIEAFNFARLCELADGGLIARKSLIRFFTCLLRFSIPEDRSALFVEPLAFLYARLSEWMLLVPFLRLLFYAFRYKLVRKHFRTREHLAYFGDLLNANRDDIVYYALGINALFIDDEFEAVTAALPRIVALLGSACLKVVHGAASIVRFVIETESSVLPPSAHPVMAQRLARSLAEAPFELKRDIGGCLASLLGICDMAAVCEVERRLPAVLRDLLEIEDEELLVMTIDRLTSWVSAIGNRAPFVQQFIENGGLDVLSDYRDCGNPQIETRASLLFTSLTQEETVCLTGDVSS
jgi:hypothetical protein